MADPIQVELESLIRLKEEIQRKQVECPQAFEQAHASINALGEKLMQAQNDWQRQIQRCQDALSRCQNMARSDAPPPDCSREEYALQQAHQNLRQVGELRARLQQRVGEFRSIENQLNNELERTVPQTLATLERKISDLARYRGIG
ncbi:MAG: hypothetical protein B6D41_22190 [Chloroflexi bacterium UTCFX4]|jgi:chromosome segregation ATPase|nr:MAG: hypothetical protein B6D41_22190 [Chloroflexi bacterium UTCFX4]